MISWLRYIDTTTKSKFNFERIAFLSLQDANLSFDDMTNWFGFSLLYFSCQHLKWNLHPRGEGVSCLILRLQLLNSFKKKFYVSEDSFHQVAINFSHFAAYGSHSDMRRTFSSSETSGYQTTCLLLHSVLFRISCISGSRPFKQLVIADNPSPGQQSIKRLTMKYKISSTV